MSRRRGCVSWAMAAGVMRVAGVRVAGVAVCGGAMRVLARRHRLSCWRRLIIISPELTRAVTRSPVRLVPGTMPPCSNARLLIMAITATTAATPAAMAAMLAGNGSDAPPLAAPARALPALALVSVLVTEVSVAVTAVCASVVAVSVAVAAVWPLVSMLMNSMTPDTAFMMLNVVLMTALIFSHAEPLPLSVSVRFITASTPPERLLQAFCAVLLKSLICFCAWPVSTSSLKGFTPSPSLAFMLALSSSTWRSASSLLMSPLSKSACMVLIFCEAPW